MTQRKNIERSQLSSFYRHPLLVQSLAWISVLSGSLVYAQGEPPAPSKNIAVPAKPEAPQAIKTESTPAVAPKPAAPEISTRTPERRTETPTARKQATPATDRQPAVTTKIELPAPKISAPPSPKPVTVENKQKERFVIDTRSNSSLSIGKNAQVDSTDYKLGSTLPPTVVLTERSTGCLRVDRNGKGLSNGSCELPPRTFSATSTPKNKPPAVATGRQEPFSLNTRTTASAKPINVGPLQLSARGFGINQISPSGNLPFSYYNPNPSPIVQPSLGDRGFLFPLSIPAPITSIFGWRINPISGDRRFHQGTDLGAPTGTPIIAVHSGRVQVADWMGGYGLAVVLQHNQNQETLYGHMSEIYVQPGQWVEQGTIIGLVGSTGNSTGPHLHFEIRELTPDGWTAVDAGTQLELAMAELIKALQAAQTKTTAQGG